MKPTLIWDLPTRLFHWLFAASFAGAWFTAEGEAWRNVHLFLGYLMLGLIGFRVIWGLVGSRYARFSSFAFGPVAGAKYLFEVLRGRARRHLGHNPAGSQAIYLLLLLGVAVGFTGIFVDNEDLHEALASLMLAVVVGHVVGVILESRVQGENLARSMVTGSKEAEPGTPASRPRRLAATALLVAVAAFGAWWLKYAPQPQPYEAGEHAQLAVAVPPAT